MTTPTFPASLESLQRSDDPMEIYRAACDARDWANALGTMLENKPALIASVARLSAMVGVTGSPDSSSEPVAWIRRHPDGSLTREVLTNVAIDQVRKASGAWLPMGLMAASVDPLQGAADWLTQAYTNCSTADLQRGLCIGYNRANRLFEAAMAKKLGDAA